MDNRILELDNLLREMYCSADIVRRSCGNGKAQYPMEATQSCLLSEIMRREAQTIRGIMSMLSETDVGDLAKFAYTLIYVNSDIIFKILPPLRALMLRRSGYTHIDDVERCLRKVMELLKLPVRNHKIDVEVEPLLKKVTETPELKELVSQLKRIEKEISSSVIYYQTRDVYSRLRLQTIIDSDQDRVKVIAVVAINAALNDINAVEEVVDRLVDELEDKRELSEPVLVFTLNYLLCGFNKIIYNLKTAYSIVPFIKLSNVENLDDYNAITNKLKYVVDVAKEMLEHVKGAANIVAQLEENQLCDVLSLSINYIWVLARILRDNVNHVFS